ncbi:unnamed protein product, partial [Medioppia subpectinata]
ANDLKTCSDSNVGSNTTARSDSTIAKQCVNNNNNVKHMNYFMTATDGNTSHTTFRDNNREHSDHYRRRPHYRSHDYYYHNSNRYSDRNRRPESVHKTDNRYSNDYSRDYRNERPNRMDKAYDERKPEKTEHRSESKTELKTDLKTALKTEAKSSLNSNERTHNHSKTYYNSSHYKSYDRNSDRRVRRPDVRLSAKSGSECSYDYHRRRGNERHNGSDEPEVDKRESVRSDPNCDNNSKGNTSCDSIVSENSSVDEYLQQKLDEITALKSIFDENILTIDEKEMKGRFLAEPVLNANGMTVFYEIYNARTDHKSESNTEEFLVQHLPPIELYFELPKEYPLKSNPKFLISCKWMDIMKLEIICYKLESLWKESKMEILFTWFSFLQNDVMDYLKTTRLDITLLSNVKPLMITKSESKALTTTLSKAVVSNRERRTVVFKPSLDKGNRTHDRRAVCDLMGRQLITYLIDYNEHKRKETFNKSYITCNICFSPHLGEDCVVFPCLHINCKNCIANYFTTLINEGTVNQLKCPETECQTSAPPNVIRDLVSEELFKKYDKIMLETLIGTMSDVYYCPRKTCGTVVIGDPDSSLAHCSACGYAFCKNCNFTYHGFDPCSNKEKMDSIHGKQHLMSKPMANGSNGSLSSPSTGTGGQSSSVPAFVLRLPDHQKELHRFISELFDSQTHTDVTIALDDGQYIKAHKLILSAFSSYFRQVLARIPNPSQYPVIVVKDMHYEDVRSLIEFIYRGCITVANHRLSQVLKCAKQLKIRGLYETNEENSDENNFDNSFTNCRNISQTVETISSTKAKEFQSYEKKLEPKEVIVLDRNKNLNENNVSREFANNWLNKNSVWIPSPPKFPISPLNQIQQRNALDLTKPLDMNRAQNGLSDNCHPISSIPVSNGYPHFGSHPSLFRSISVDECQLNKNKHLMNGFHDHEKRAPSSLDGHLDDNNNDMDTDYRKEKKRSLNIFHAAKYRNRKKQQLETLFSEENELQKNNCLAKIQIEKLEATILSLIWQQTKRSFSGQTVFTCPVCGNVQNDVPKLRSHINMLHNDTEALMKFLMLQRSPTFTNSVNNTNNNSTNSHNSTAMHTITAAATGAHNGRHPTPSVITLPYHLNTSQ